MSLRIKSKKPKRRYAVVNPAWVRAPYEQRLLDRDGKTIPQDFPRRFATKAEAIAGKNHVPHMKLTTSLTRHNRQMDAALKIQHPMPPVTIPTNAGLNAIADIINGVSNRPIGSGLVGYSSRRYTGQHD